MNSTHEPTVQIIAAILFAVAIAHTFSTKWFEHLAHTRPRHAGLWHLLGEVEIVFGFWAMVLVVTLFAIDGTATATAYVDSRNFTEPLFVFAIMVIAATRPILQASTLAVHALARLLPLPGGMGYFLVVMTGVPLLGSFITEPAAMTLAALILADRFFSQSISERMKYATLGVLFVNVSIGGTLTPFAAPPVLMVAGTWGWDMEFMLSTFGWKAAIAVALNAVLLTALFRRELADLPPPEAGGAALTVPLPLVVVHLLFLIGVVVLRAPPCDVHGAVPLLSGDLAGLRTPPG